MPAEQENRCEVHNVPLISRKVFGLGNIVVTPAAERLAIRDVLPHCLEWFYSETPDEYYTEPRDVLLCECCQSQVASEIEKYRRQMEAIEAGNGVYAIIHWSGSEPTVQELAALRKVVPEFRDLGLSEVQRKLKGSDGWQLGIVQGFALDELKHAALANGLLLELKEVAG